MVKVTQKRILFFLSGSVLEVKMSINSVKFDSARKVYRLLGHLNQADVVMNAPETVQKLDDVCNLSALAEIRKTPIPKIAKVQAQEKLAKVFKVVI